MGHGDKPAATARDGCPPGMCPGAMPGSHDSTTRLPRPRKPFPSPWGSLPRDHRSRPQSTPPARPAPSGKVTPGIRTAGTAEHDPGDVSPAPDASRNPAQGQLAGANLEGRRAPGAPKFFPPTPPGPIPLLPGRSEPAGPSSFRSKRRSTCPAARRVSRSCPGHGGFPCPGARPRAGSGHVPGSRTPSAFPGASGQCPVPAFPVIPARRPRGGQMGSETGRYRGHPAPHGPPSPAQCPLYWSCCCPPVPAPSRPTPHPTASAWSQSLRWWCQTP